MQEKISANSLARLERKSLSDVVKAVEEDLIDGKKFKAIRKKMVLTQEELAQKLEMSTSNLRRIERSGRTMIRPESIRKLAALRRIEPSDQLLELSPTNGVAAPPPPSNGDAPNLPESPNSSNQILEGLSKPDLARLGLKVLERLWPMAGTPQAKMRIKMAIDTCQRIIQTHEKHQRKPEPKAKGA